MIDNYEQAIALLEKMKASLPIPIKVTPESMQRMGKEGDKFSRDHIFMVESVLYAGDEGGIMCMLKTDIDDKAMYGLSLTHLRIQEDHPLAEEIKNYQRKRVMRLALQDGKVGKAQRLAKQFKKKKGFG
ncbi:MAG: hypothetical protein ACKN9E_10545 [Microcystaceae cyanobacterium]